MTLVLYSLLIITNLLFAFFKRKSKILITISLLFIILLITGAGPNYSGQNDYINYQRSYELLNNLGVFERPEFGYTLLVKLGHLINLSFFDFRLIITAICILLIYKKLVSRYVNNPHLFLALYTLYPVIADSELFRNFIAMTIFLMSIKFLETGLLQDKIKCFLLLLLASSIHTVFIFFLPVIFVNTRRNVLLKYIAFGSLLLSVIMVINNNQFPYEELLFPEINYEKATRYLSSRTNYGFLIPVFFHSLSLVLVSWSRNLLYKFGGNQNIIRSKFIKQNKVYPISNFSQKDYLDIALNINLTILISFPLFLITTKFIRLPKNILIINFLVYSTILEKMRAKSLDSALYIIIIVVSVILMLILHFVINTPPERLLIPFFTQHMFFN